MFRFGRRGHPDAIVEAGVGIPARDGGAAEGVEERADRFPGTGLAFCTEPGLDVREKEIVQDRDE